MGWDDRRTGPDQRHMPMWVGPRPLWSPPADMHEAGIVHGGSPDLARILDATHCCTTTATWDQQVAYSKKVAKHHVWLHANPLRLVRRAVAKSLRSPLTPVELCQRRGAAFARLRMEAQLYSLRASATRFTGKYWAAPYASSLLPRSRARARCGLGAFAPAPADHVLASR